MASGNGSRGSPSDHSMEIAQLTEVLNIDNHRAEKLFQDADCDFDAAVALHFAQQVGEAGPSNLSPRGTPQRVTQLQRAVLELGLPPITLPQARLLLKKARNSVERAVECYIADPNEAGPAGLPQRAETIDLASSSSEDEAAPDTAAQEEETPELEPSGEEHEEEQEEEGVGDLSSMPLSPDVSEAEIDEESSISGSDDSEDEMEISENEGPVVVAQAPAEEEEFWRKAGEEYDKKFKMKVLPRAQAAPLPDFDVAIYQAARKARSARPRKLLLPLAHLRNKNGKLFAEDPASVPEVVEPPQPLGTSLLLGSVLLPVHGVNKKRLQRLVNESRGPLEWSSTSSGAYSYVFPQPFSIARSYAEHLTLEAVVGAATWTAVLNGKIPAQLSLGGDDLNDAGQGKKHNTELPVVTVRQGMAWVSQFLGALASLDLREAVEPRFTLVTVKEDGVKETANAGGASGSGSDALSGRKRSKSLPAEEERDEGNEEQIAKKRKAEVPNSVEAALGKRMSGRRSATPSGTVGNGNKKKNQGDGKGKQDTLESVPLPTHVKVEVRLTAKALGLLYQGDADGTTKKGQAAGPILGFWRTNSNAMGILLSTLLCHGQGLTLGPDSDGMLNYCDAQEEELAEVDALSWQELRAQFNVSKLLAAVSPGKRQAGGKQSISAPKPVGLRTVPKNYQLSGLKWMLDREKKGDALQRGHALLHPSWIQLVTAGGKLVYCQRMRAHMLTDLFYTAPTVGTCGGFICDEMGLGKSLQTLMLVLENRPLTGWAVEELQGDEVVSRTDPIPIKTTLLVAPTTLLSQWEDEIEKHLQDSAMKWGRFVDPNDMHAMRALKEGRGEVEEEQLDKNGRPRRRPARAETKVTGAQSVRCVLCAAGKSGLPAELHTLDLCLCSYEHLRDQLGSSQGNNISVLQQFGFWRVCLDEAQLIANSSSVAAIMASSLWRRHAWVVTGTPITSRLSEIRGLLEFLALEPIYQAEEWGRLVQQGCDFVRRHGLMTLRGLLRGVMLRRSKEDVADELGLPPCSREDLSITLSTVERTSYERLKREFLDAVRQVRRHQDAALHGPGSMPARAGAGGRATAALTALRQSTCHPMVVASNAALMGGHRLSMAEIIERLMSQAYNEFDASLRSLLHAQVLEAAAGVATHVGQVSRMFPELLEIIDANAMVAELTLEERNKCPELRFHTGDLGTSKVPPYMRTYYRRELLNDVQQKLHVQRKECDAEDEDLQQKREVYKQEVFEAAQAWDIANPPKEKKEKKEKGGKKKRGKRSESRAEEEQEEGNGGAGGDVGHVNGRASGGADEDATAPLTDKAGEANGANGAHEDGQGGSLRPSSARDQRKGPTPQAMKHARAALGPRPQLPPDRLTLRQDANTRRRSWERLKLATLELIVHLHKETLSEVRRKWKEAAEKAASRLDKEVVREELTDAVKDLEELRAELGLVSDADAAAAAGGIRRSRRQAGIDAESDTEVFLDPAELAEQLENAVAMVREYKDLCAGRDAEKSTENRVESAKKEAQDLYHRLKFVRQQQSRAEEEANPGAAGPSVAQDDLKSCPICFDDLSMGNLMITTCSHRFCPDCIREALSRAAPQRAPCPICRTPLAETDLFEAISEAEAAVAARAAAATNATTAEYGAKVAAVLDILANMKDSDPGSKCVIFSSWGRVLRLVGDALAANGVKFAGLAGANASKRVSELHNFLHNPECTVLMVLMSNSGGAAGLTLTAASTAIILEPCINPGLEAQAAARIYRLGQTKPTRVVRLLADDTVDALVVEQQRWKLEAGSGAVQADEVDHGTIVTLGDMLRGADGGGGGEDGGVQGAEVHEDENGAGPSGTGRQSSRRS